MDLQDAAPIVMPKLPPAVQEAALQQLVSISQSLADFDVPPVVHQAMSAFASILKSGFQPLGADFANLLHILGSAELWDQAFALYWSAPCQVRTSFYPSTHSERRPPLRASPSTCRCRLGSNFQTFSYSHNGSQAF